MMLGMSVGMEALSEHTLLNTDRLIGTVLSAVMHKKQAFRSLRQV